MTKSARQPLNSFQDLHQSVCAYQPCAAGRHRKLRTLKTTDTHEAKRLVNVTECQGNVQQAVQMVE